MKIKLGNAIRKINVSLIASLIVYIVMLVDIIKDIGKSFPGYTIGWMHVFAMLVYSLLFFWMGYTTHKDRVNLRKN